MATPFESTPKWFNAEYYLSSKLAQLIATEPKAEWTRESLIKALNDNGYSNPYDHYVAYGDGEGLSPSPYFNNVEYLAAKTAQMGSTWTTEMVAKAISDAGMTLMEHYEKYGSTEGLSPSSAFDQNKYYEAKLDQLQTAEPDKGWTMESMKEAFAAAGLTPLDHFLMYAKEEKLDSFDYSTTGAPIPHPGNTKIVLTTGVDTVTPDATEATLKTSDRDDVISGLVSSTSTKSTLNPNDVIDGGDGQDTLKVDLQASTFAFKDGSMKSVETIELKTSSTNTFDAKKVEGAKHYVMDGGENSKATVTNVDSAAVDYSIKMGKGEFNVKVVDTALTGKEDSVSVTLNGAGTDAANRVDLSVAGVKSGVVEGLALMAQGKDNFVSVAEGHETISVAGAGNVDMVTTTGLKSFDASTATGKVVANLSAADATLKTVNGGAGDDTITVGTAALAGTVFDGGAGDNDTLIFSGTPAATDKTTISGFEKIQLGAGTLNGTNITGLQEVLVKGTTPTVVIDKLANDTLTLSLEGSSTSVTYNGTGTLNLQSVDSDGSQNANTAGDVFANNVQTLNIVNNDHEGASGSLAISDIEAKAATSLTVNTGEYGVTIAGAEFNNVDTITVTGSGNFGFATGTSLAKLTSIDAAGMTGNFSFDLIGGTALQKSDGGFSITGSATGTNTIKGTSSNDYFSFTGGTSTNTLDMSGGGLDTVELGTSEAYTVQIKAATASDGTDLVTVKNFGGDDTIKLDAGTSSVYSTDFKTLASGKVFGGELDDVTTKATVADLTPTELAGLDGLKANAHNFFGGSASVYLAVEYKGSVGVFAVTLASVASATGYTAGNLTNLKLVGVLEDTDISDFSAGSFLG